MKILRSRMLVTVLVGAYVLALFACSAAGTGEDESLEGSWLVTHAEPIGYDQDDPTDLTDAQLFEFSGSDVELVFFLDTDQVMGQRGTYSVSGDTLVLTFDEWWNDAAEPPDWEADNDSVNLTFSLSGDTLSIVPPGETEGVALSKANFSVRPELVGTWYEDSGIYEMVLESSGQCSYYASDSPGSPIQDGPWEATEGYIRSVDTLSGTVEFLNPYTLQDGGSTLVVDVTGGDQLIYHDTAPH